MTTPSSRSAIDENLSGEELTKAREEFHDKLRAGYEGNECADLGVNFQLCLFDTQVGTTVTILYHKRFFFCYMASVIFGIICQCYHERVPIEKSVVLMT